MTISATALRGTPLTPAHEDGQYIPGVCNIGPQEIARRRRTGHFGLIVSVVVLVALIVVDAPPLLRLVLFFPVALSASGYLQAYLKFCAGFGQIGVFNFGDRSAIEHIEDKAARRKDRVKAWQISIFSGVIGLAVAIAAVLLPI